jgi:hypothetical protein
MSDVALHATGRGAWRRVATACRQFLQAMVEGSRRRAGIGGYRS